LKLDERTARESHPERSDEVDNEDDPDYYLDQLQNKESASDQSLAFIQDRQALDYANVDPGHAGYSVDV